MIPELPELPELPEIARNGRPSHSRTSRAPFEGAGETGKGTGDIGAIDRTPYAGGFIWGCGSHSGSHPQARGAAAVVCSLCANLHTLGGKPWPNLTSKEILGALQIHGKRRANCLFPAINAKPTPMKMTADGSGIGEVA